MRAKVAKIRDKTVFVYVDVSHDAIKFKVISTIDPTEDEVKTLQQEFGYHPNGYGGPDMIRKIHNNMLNTYETTWKCYGTCD